MKHIIKKFVKRKGRLSKKHSLKKTITWRIIGSTTTGLVAFAFTGNLGNSTYITIVNALLLTLFYYLHERFWNRI
jgi:uncharacterized membrane protein